MPMFEMEDKENDNKAQLAQISNKLLAVTEPDKKETTLKPRRSVLKEFDPFAKDSPCVPKNQSPPQASIREEDYFEDAETSLKLIGTPSKSSTDLLTFAEPPEPVVLEWPSLNPADTSDLEYVEAFESLPPQPYDHTLKGPLCVEITEANEEENVLDVFIGPENTTFGLENNESEEMVSLNATLGLSAALQRLKIMDTASGNNSDFITSLRVEDTENEDSLNDTFENYVKPVENPDGNTAQDELEKDASRESPVENKLDEIVASEANQVYLDELLVLEANNKVPETPENVYPVATQSENQNHAEKVDNSTQKVREDSGASNYESDIKKMPLNTVKSPNESLNDDMDEALTSILSSFSKTIDLEESVLIEHSDNSKSDISNDSRGTLNQTVNNTIDISSTGLNTTRVKDISEENEVVEEETIKNELNEVQSVKDQNLEEEMPKELPDSNNEKNRLDRTIDISENAKEIAEDSQANASNISYEVLASKDDKITNKEPEYDVTADVNANHEEHGTESVNFVKKFVGAENLNQTSVKEDEIVDSTHDFEEKEVLSHSIPENTVSFTEEHASNTPDKSSNRVSSSMDDGLHPEKVLNTTDISEKAVCDSKIKISRTESQNNGVEGSTMEIEDVDTQNFLTNDVQSVTDHVSKINDVDPCNSLPNETDTGNLNNTNVLNVTSNVESPVTNIYKELNVTANVTKINDGGSRNSLPNIVQSPDCHSVKAFDTTTIVDSPVIKTNDVGPGDYISDDIQSTTLQNEANIEDMNHTKELNVTANVETSVSNIKDEGSINSLPNIVQSPDYHSVKAFDTRTNDLGPGDYISDDIQSTTLQNEANIEDMNHTKELNVTANVETSVSNIKDEGSINSLPNIVQSPDYHSVKAFDTRTNDLGPGDYISDDIQSTTLQNEANVEDMNHTKELNVTANVEIPVSNIKDEGPINSLPNIVQSPDCHSVKVFDTTTIVDSPVIKTSDVGPGDSNSDDFQSPSCAEKILNTTTNVESSVIKIIKDCIAVNALNTTTNIAASSLLQIDEVLNTTSNVESPDIKTDASNIQKNTNLNETKVLNTTAKVESPPIKVDDVNLQNPPQNDVDNTNLTSSNDSCPVFKQNKSLQDNYVMVDSLEDPILEKKDSLDDEETQKDLNKGTIMVDSLEGPILPKRIHNNTNKSRLRAKTSSTSSDKVSLNTPNEQNGNEDEINSTKADQNGNTGTHSAEANGDIEANEQGVVRVADPEPVKKVEGLEEEVQATQQRCLESMQVAQRYKTDVVKYQTVLREYEKQIVKQDRDLQILRQENHTMCKHFSTLELAFSDVFQKYERTKNVVQKYKENEERLTKALISTEELANHYADEYQKAKAWLREQVDKMNEKIQLTKEKYEQEITGLRTKVKRLEIKCVAQEINLKQKTEECRQLAALCDDITG